MKLAQLLLTLVLVGTAVCAQQPSDVAAAFTASKVVPDVFPTFNPTALLNVVFNDQATGKKIPVTTGANLTTEQVALRPSFSLQSGDFSLPSQTFVLFMADPDAPTPQNNSLAPIRHLIASGLQIADSGSLAEGAALVNDTPAISEYLSPGPPTADPHRYTLLLFIQPENFTVDAASALVNASTPVTNFDFKGSVAELGLGDPVAGNFWFTANTTAAATGSNSTHASGNGAGTGNSTSAGSDPASQRGNTGVFIDISGVMVSSWAVAVLLATSLL